VTETLKAGRKLDKRIATEVMGHRVVETDDCNGEDNYWIADAMIDRLDWLGLPNYSTRIEDAWLLVEKIALRGYFHLRWVPSMQQWQAIIDATLPQDRIDGKYCNTAPLAICLAALAAVGRGE